MNRRLALCAAPQFLIAFEFSAMTVSIPDLASELGLAGGRIPLVYAAYSLPFGSLLLAGGRIADQVGARRCIIIGLALFAGGAVGVAAAPTAPVVMACRVTEGAGAALMTPAALALTAATFPDRRDRHAALSWYAAAISVGFVLGAIVAGLAGELLGWRAALAGAGVGALGALTGAGTARWPERSRGSPWRPDGMVVGLATSAALAASLLVALLSAGLLTPRGLIATLLAATGFAVAAHRRGGSRGGILLPAGTDLGAVFRSAVGGGAAVTATGVTGTLLLSAYLQDARSYSPIAVAVVFSAFGLSAFRGRVIAARLAGRHGVLPVLATGLVIQGIALAVLGAAVGPAPSALLVILTAAFGLGHVIANAGVAFCATAGPSRWHGTAGGIVSSAQYLGAALGPAGIVATVAEHPAAAPSGLVVAGALSCLAGLLIAAGRRPSSLRR